MLVEIKKYKEQKRAITIIYLKYFCGFDLKGSPVNRFKEKI